MRLNILIIRLFTAFILYGVHAPVSAQTSAIADSLLNVFSVAKDSQSKIVALLGLSAEILGSDQNKALNFSQQAYLLSLQSGNKVGEINSLMQKGNCYFRMGEYQLAMECAESSKSLAEELKMDKEIALSLNIIGRIYAELGGYENSSVQFFKSLTIFETMHDLKGMSESFGFIGAVYYFQKDYSKALKYLNKSISIARKLGDKSLLFKPLNNIAIVYTDLKKYDSVLVYSNEVLRLNLQRNDKLFIGINYINIGNAQLKQLKYDDALGSFQKALELSKEINNRFYFANCNVYMGQYFFETGNKSASIDAFKTALTVAQENGYTEIINRASKELGDLYLERKDTSNAFIYKIIENQSKDSLSQLRKEKTMANLELQYQSEKKEFEKKIAQQKKENMMVIIILGLISGLIITILIISRQRIKAKNATLEKQTIEKELGFKNKELSINLMALMKKNEMLSDISSRLIQIEKEAVKEETKEAINKISHELKKNADEKIWKEFSVRFQEVHSGFYEALLAKFPDLTQNELKLCAFLKLNMSTKDISELTGQTKLTLENSRYRLRKKLGIANSEVNLVTFLLQI
jgi:tetratricopeptide (TPR) repeat protein